VNVTCGVKGVRRPLQSASPSYIVATLLYVTAKEASSSVFNGDGSARLTFLHLEKPWRSDGSVVAATKTWRREK
jgi:hypothetical protein